MTPTTEQQAVIEAVAGDSRVLTVAAVPGSGKTTTVCGMVNRYLELNPNNKVVVITFTTASAGDIRKRIANDSVYFVGTGHAFFLKMLKAHGTLMGLKKDLSVIQPSMAESIMKEIRVSMRNQDSLDDLFRAARQAKFLDPAAHQIGEWDKVAMAYHRRCVESGVIDYDSIISFGRHLFEMHRPVEVDLLVVDEVQDSSGTDWGAYRAIKPNRAVFVGDPDQSIYEWRGASPQIFLGVCQKPTTKLLPLTTNFRFGPRIAHLANQLIRNNKSRIENRIVTASMEPNLLYLERPKDEQEETKAAVLWAAEHRTDSAIICRYRATVNRTKEALKAAGITVVGTEATRPQDWPKAMARLSIIGNPYNREIAYQEAVSEFGVARANQIRKQSVETRTAIAFLCEGFYPQEFIEDMPAPDEILTVATGLLQEVPGISRATIAMIDEIVGELPDGASIEDLVLAIGEHRQEKSGIGVMVSTIHGCKGLEFDDILLPSWTQGDFPRKVTEEERRLAYVAITRARKTITISSPETVEGRTRDRSVFIDEMLAL